MKSSIIISIYSKERLNDLLDCIESIKNQTVHYHEIIVVPDPNPAVIDFYKTKLDKDIRLIISDGLGLSNARNAGIKNSNGDIVVFIDDDAKADRDWLRNLLKNYEDGNVIGVGGLIKPLWKDVRPSWFPEELDWVVGCSYKGLPERKEVRNPLGCNMSFKKEIFDKIGYFRPDIGRFGKRLLSGEEAELSMRISKNFPHLKIIYDPSAIVYHKVKGNRLNLKYLVIRSFNEGISKAMISDSHVFSSTFFRTESSYLLYLFKTAIPSHIKRFYRFNSLSKILVLCISIFSVVLGFISVKIKIIKI